jgi:CIC family chloride channel protein
MRVLVACGAAGGIAATFNAPLAGVFFAMELILRSFTAESFGMVVLSSVTASVIGRAALGDTAFLELPTFTVEHPVDYLLFAALGLLAGVVGVVFTRVLYWIEDACDRVWRGPEWARPAVGGVLLGGLLLALPEMYGVGYPVLDRGVTGTYALWFLVVLLVGKMVATSLTIGIGGSGGVFAPSLFIGAMLGAAYGGALHLAIPALSGPVGAYGLIGMGAVFAGAARAPITAVIIMFELTGEYSIILPLMAAIVLATGVSHLVARDTIYTLKLRRRGIDLDEHPSTAALTTITARAAMEATTLTVPADLPLARAAQVMSDEGTGQLAVVDREGRYVGVLTARGVTDGLADGEHDDVPAGSMAEQVPSVRGDQPLEAALDALDTAATPAVPVLDPGRDAVIGWLTHQRILSTIRSRPSPTAAPDGAVPAS